MALDPSAAPCEKEEGFNQMLIEFRQQAEKLWQILRADSLERAVTGLAIFNSYAQELSPQPQALIEENPNRYIIQCLDFLKYYLLPCLLQLGLFQRNFLLAIWVHTRCLAPSGNLSA
ncbi:hypothetical protein [Candidatus Coxiella mudrowiae]|uniref:hypothetical protein n=1 Tax=Candidatus Coxiella mudrowiae TaxID=2054173 RepID=UPI000C28D1C3|nr:hypothetical protein [Candidatus Coxiella mudrowiae]